MRDAFGGAFSIKLMLIFLVLYVSFICVALNYARAFRVKNRIINLIEQNEGIDTVNVSDTIHGQIQTYLNTSGYKIDPTSYSAIAPKSKCGNDIIAPGYCVYKSSSTPAYYGVETYLLFHIPIVGVDFPIVVRGETRVIEIP